MKRECLSCGQEDMVYAVRDVPYSYRAHETVISKVKGWHCSHCGEVEFDPGEGARFAEIMKRIANDINVLEAAEILRIRKKLKLTQQEAARITGGGPNAFSRYESGKAKPMPAVINLFKLLDNHPSLLDEIKSWGSLVLGKTVGK
jgi:HTH-type transcriptional regulator/antitoxin MqsA